MYTVDKCLCCYIVPTSAPWIIEVKSEFPASIIVTWRPPLRRHHNGLLIGYMVHYFKYGSNETDDVVTFVNTSPHVISGLMSSTNYSIQLAAVNSNGTGPFSLPVVAESGNESELSVLCFFCDICTQH